MERPSETRLEIAFCSARAARYACERWHYADTYPMGKAVRFGVWENGSFIGAVIYTQGAGMTTQRVERFGLERREACELARVALADHDTPVTQIIAETLRRLKDANPGLRLVISFADPAQGHHGGIYQAGNWVYTGTSNSVKEYWVDGAWRHNRSIAAIGTKAQRDGSHDAYLRWRRQLPTRTLPGKHRYMYPLDRAVRRRILEDALPYPDADQVSEARRQTSGLEGSVQSRRSAP